MRNLICTLSFAFLSMVGALPASADAGASGTGSQALSSAASPKRGSASNTAVATSPGTPQTAAPTSTVVNIGEATPEQLEQLPGVGPSKAGAIVAHRKQHPFKKLEDLMRVKGIGKKTFARLKPMLTLSGPTLLPEQKAVAQRR
jgi:competence protein ComEA